MNRPAIRSILVVGDGIVGRSAALAFTRALAGVEVSLLALPDIAPGMLDRFPTALPQIGRFHAAIGFDEIDLVRRGIAAHHLGTLFEGGGPSPWVHSFGAVGAGEGAIPFHQIWLAARQRGKALPYHRYSSASVIGIARKFVHPSGDHSSRLASYLYGLRLHPDRYKALLTTATESIALAQGTIAEIKRREDGGIDRLRLADGSELTADLFVDCSGPTAVVANSDDEREDWQDLLPACHVTTDLEDSAQLQPLDMAEADANGWRLTASVPGATMRAGIGINASPRSTSFRPGRRVAAFRANVLAIGDAAVSLDPMHGTSLSLAHHAILRAISLLPGRDCNPLELAEYNRLTALEADRARDFHALFQARWATTATLPDSLGRTLTQWQSRGRLPFFEEESFPDSSWAQALIGLDILPDAVSPIALAVDPDAAARAMSDLAANLESLGTRLPDYRDYLDRIADTPPTGRHR